MIVNGQQTHRIRLVSQHLKESVSKDVCRSLWTRDVPVFQVLLAYRVWQGKGLDPTGELWKAFCSGCHGGLNDLGNLRAFMPTREALAAASDGEMDGKIWEEVQAITETGNEPVDIELFATREEVGLPTEFF